jgi:ferredoxin
MMEELRKKARELLDGEAVKVVIGYGPGSEPDRARAVFVRKPEQADSLIFDDRCQQNLAVYLTKPEIKVLGKPAIVATPAVLRSILQLAAENQIADGQIVALDVGANGQVSALSDFKTIEEAVATLPVGLSSQEKEAIAKVQAMSRAERWAFWVDQFSACLRCYACRAACPMCYCGRCAVECNQPQWIASVPHPSANLEWHLARAMHMTGRCINCGYCAKACPVGIPINLLGQMLTQEVEAEFGLHAGVSAKREYVLGTFKPEDKESFIR